MIAHDVRRMAVCEVCGNIVPNPVLGRHAKCWPVKELVNFPAEVLFKIRVCDVSTRVMRAILRKLDREEEKP